MTRHTRLSRIQGRVQSQVLVRVNTQNIVRDNICYGRYDASRGTTPTAYFLGKVCLARNLEPKIPEESLVTKLAYHYEEGIARAQLVRQVKTVQSMAALLENYEHYEVL